MKLFAHVIGAGLLAAAPAHAADIARADISDRDGNTVGGVSIRDTASGVALVTISLADVPPGLHGVHIHETGDCTAPDFTSAGGHLSGDADHGILSEGRPHPGDLPNLTVVSDGSAQVEYFAPNLTVADLMDEDGAAFIVHSGPDDYQSQPSGDAGERIACGVFTGG